MAPTVVRARVADGAILGAIVFAVVAAGGVWVAWWWTNPFAISDPLSAHVRLWLFNANPGRSAALAKLADAGLLFQYFSGFATAIVTALIAGIAVGARTAAPRDDLIHVRGRRLLTYARSAAQEASAHGKPDGVHLAAGVRISRARERSGLLVVGAPGSGKTVFLKLLIEQVIVRGDRALLLDVKGDFTAQFPAGFILIAPWDSRGAVWAIARDVRTAQDARRFAAALIPASSDPMWSSAARQILTAVIIYLQATRSTEWGFRTLAEALGQPLDVLKKIVEEHLPEASRAVEDASKTTQGIMINLSAFCSPIFDLAVAWGDGGNFSICEWLAGREHSKFKTVVLQHNAKYSELSRPLITAMVEVLSAEIVSPSYAEAKALPLWLFLDELPQLNKLNGLAPLIEVGRSKEVRVVIASQTIEQLRELYGREVAESFAAMLGTAVIFRLGGVQSCEFASQMAGVREVERPVVQAVSPGSRGPGVQYSAATIPTMMPAEFAQLRTFKGGVEGVLIAQGFANAYRLIWSFPKNWEDRRASHEPAKWLSAKPKNPFLPPTGVNVAAPSSVPVSQLSAAADRRSRGPTEPAVHGSKFESVASAPESKAEENQVTNKPTTAAAGHLAEVVVPGAGVIKEAAEALANVAEGVDTVGGTRSPQRFVKRKWRRRSEIEQQVQGEA